MQKIIMADITLRESQQNAVPLSFREKLEMARLLEKTGVDVIETGAVGEAEADLITVRTLAGNTAKAVLACPVGPSEAELNRTWDALQHAAHPRINVVVSVSAVQMEYTYHMKQPKLLEAVSKVISAAVALCPDVEFTAADATRSDAAFLRDVIRAAIAAGAKTVTVCDSAGQIMPGEVTAFIRDLYNDVPELKDVCLSMEFRNELGLASANAIAAMEAGAGQLKMTYNGSGFLSLTELAQIIRLRGDAMNITCNLDHTGLQRACKQMEKMYEASRDQRNPLSRLQNSEPQGSEHQVPLDASADLLTVRRRVEAMGYDLSEEDVERIYLRFTELAAKKVLDNRDLEALIAENARLVPPAYQLENFVINSGNAISGTACIRVSHNGQHMQTVALGDGPIDAAFLCIEQLVGHHFELEDFQVHSVTEGREAMGDALVKLRYEGRLYSGRGLSTDVIGASIRAYLNAVNKIVHEDEQK